MMSSRGIKRKLAWVIFPGIIGLLLLAACSPATSTSGSPTSSALGTTVIGTEASTSAFGGTAVGTEAGTTVASTEAGTTSASTEASTAMPSEQSTSGVSTQSSTSSAASTSVGTSVAGSTAATTAQPGSALLIANNALIGLPVVDNTTSQAGTVADVLVNMTGTVTAVVINVNGANTSGSAGTPSANTTSSAVGTSGAASTPSANTTSSAVSTSSTNSTPSANSTTTTGSNLTGTGTPGTNMATAQYVAVNWSEIQADPTNNRLVYQGSASTLTNGQTFDEQAFCNGYFIPSTAGTGSGGGATTASFAGLWRLGGPLNMVNLQDANGTPLGVMQSVILDVNSGRALYALVNLANQGTPSANSTTGVAGTPSANSTSGAVSTTTSNSTGTGSNGTGASTTCPSSNGSSTTTGVTNASNSVVVPFTNLHISSANQTTSTPPVMVQVPMTKIESAPTLNSANVPMWPQMAPPGWNSNINSYWGIAGQ
jgi:sporulation protein YlmC with PRC-barrel domain